MAFPTEQADPGHAGLQAAAAVLTYMERKRDPEHRRLKLATDIGRLADRLPDGDERAERLHCLARLLALVKTQGEAAVVLDELGSLVAEMS